jgi:nucleoside-diphosphate-sugar epimerase
MGKISVYGNGSREQDFISATDTTSAILKIVEKQTFGVYNLCSSKPVTMISLANTLTNYLGSGSVVVGEEEDTNDGAKARYCNQKLRNVIDWNPIQDLKEMLTKMKIGL